MTTAPKEGVTAMAATDAGIEKSGMSIVDPAKYRLRVLAISVAGYGFDGMDIVVFALALPLLFKAWPGFTLVHAGFIGTAMLLGMSLGGYVFGPIADKFGRKRALVWCIAFFGIVTGISGFAQNYVQLAVLRFLAGLGLGAEWALGSTFLQEFTEPEKRAKFGSVMMLGWPIAYGFTILFAHFCTPIFGWQCLYWLGATAIILALYIHFAIPESPVWLKHREEKKMGIQAGTAKAEVGFGDLFKKANIRSFLWAMIICTSLLITYWAVNTWLPTVLSKERGMSPKIFSSFLLAFQVGAVIGLLTGGFLGDKFGKRVTMALFSFLTAVMFYVWLGLKWDNTMFFVWGWIYQVTSSVLWAILGAYLAEQFPTNIRAVGTAASYSTGRLISTLVPFVMGAVAMQIGLTATLGVITIFYIIGMLGVLMLRDMRVHI